MARSVEGGAALATPFMEAGTTARAGPTRVGSWRGGLSPEGLDVHGLAWGVGHLGSLFFSGLLSTAGVDGLVQSEVFLLKEVFDGVSDEEAFDDLIADALLGAVVGAELAGLGELPKADEEVVEGFSGLLYAVAERASLYGLVAVALDVMLNYRNDLCHFASLIITEAKVLDDGHSLTRETQG